MGESACLMQPFSYVSGIPNEAKEGNPIHALGQSISFGRFMSESLAWEKWSTFSHNRYVEEAERHSQRGLVAQKKAFFEAHYKNMAARKAAALLEQANAAAALNNAVPEEPDSGKENSTQDSQTLISNSEATIHGHDSNVEMGKFDSIQVEVADPANENPVLVENTEKVEISSQAVDVNGRKEEKETELSGTTQMRKPLSKRNQEDCLPMGKKKPTFSSSKSSSIHQKAAKDGSSKDNNIATPISKKPALLDSAEKKTSTPKSLHKSVNFTPIRELNRLTSTVIRKIENSRFGANSSKASKDCQSPLRTPTMVIKNEIKQRPQTTPYSEKKSSTTPLNPSASGSKTAGPKWHLLPTECSNFLSACRNKARSPFSSTPFRLRTEERAARRKKKLEDKFNANEAEKNQMQTKLKDKEEKENGKLRPTLCFKARPLPDFYKQRKAPKNEIKRVPSTHPQSPKPSTDPSPNKIDGKTSQPPHTPLVKNSGSKHIQGKNSRTHIPTFSLISRSTKITHENTSPNIQLG
nr:protein WVD2-like 7 isoform X1 [Ziziphus jujuba var. spinosa]